MIASSRLTSAQMALLDLFSFPMSEEEVVAMRQVLMQHFRARLEEEAHKVIQHTGLTTTEFEERLTFENRTEQLGRIRAAR